MNRFFPIAGVSATAGGWLRIANIFAPLVLPPVVLAALYFVTDVLLLVGIGGFWLKRRAAMGIAGTAGIAIFVAGILAIRASAFGIGNYQLGAGIALMGLGIYSIGALVRGTTPTYAAISWILALACGVAVIIGLPSAASVIAAATAAALFGAGFLAIGVDLFPHLAWVPRRL